MSHCVYWIRCIGHTDIMSQGYVGVTMDAEKRFNQHLKRTQNRHLGFAIKKYGWDNLIKSIVIIAEKDYCLDLEKKIRPTDSVGWNLIAGGGNPPIIRGKRPILCGRTPWNKGKAMSPETKEKLRQSAKAQWKDPDMRKLLSDLKKGKPSNALGRKHTAETIARMSQVKMGIPSGKKGLKLSGDTLQNVINASRVPWVCPHCNKEGMGRGAANRWHFDKCKQKVNV